MTLSERPPRSSSPVWLFLLGGLVTALLWTPGAPMVVAVLIVVPGFVIDRLRGGTGIVGGLVSSSILGVIWGLAWMEFPGENLFSGLISVAPALYFIFVLSLLWGGLVSVTLYWLIKSYHDHRRKVQGAETRRIQFTLGQLMGVIALCAVAFAALLTPFAFFVVALGIIVPGFAIDRYRGGAGILGAMISAAVALVSLGIAAYAYFYLNPDPAWLEYLGSPVLTLVLLATAGVAWGAVAGTALDVILLVAKSYAISRPRRDDTSPEVMWLPDETRP